jgi:hypothetical protein
VRPHADCKDCEKRIFTKNYATIFALALALWFCNYSPAFAIQQYVCYGLFNHSNRITSGYMGSFSPGNETFGSIPISLASVRDYCHDNGGGAYYSTYQPYGHTLLATRATTVAGYDYTRHVQTWDISSVANQLGCSTANKPINFPGINQVIALLPQSPSNMRIPTLINKMAGENSLAGNLAIELYSGAWQFLGILTSFKLFKIFFKGG